MARKKIMKQVSKRSVIQMLAGLISDNLGLSEDNKEHVADMLALAWISGTHYSLIFPELASSELTGSQEVYDLARDTVKQFLRVELGKRWAIFVKPAMILEQYLFPITRLELEDYSYFLGKN